MRLAVFASFIAILVPFPAFCQVDFGPKPGEKRWIDRPFTLNFCEKAPKPGKYEGQGHCRDLAGGSLVVRSRVVGPYGVRIGSMVEWTAGGAPERGYVGDLTLTHTETQHQKAVADKAECDRRGGIRIGMTRDQVEASCWGKPIKTNLTRTAGGDFEQLVYAGSNYLYLTNGILTSIQMSK